MKASLNFGKGLNSEEAGKKLNFTEQNRAETRELRPWKRPRKILQENGDRVYKSQSRL